MGGGVRGGASVPGCAAIGKSASEFVSVLLGCNWVDF